MIDGQNDRSHWRFQQGGEVWRCPKCHAAGRGDKIAAIKVIPFVEVRKGGRTRKPAEVLCCAYCFLTDGTITEV